jgi:hypothetical protein
MIGSATGQKLGYSVGLVRDVTGDGRGEIIIGAPEADGPLGPKTGYAILRSPEHNGFYRMFYGELPGDLFGRAVSSAGDVDGDGLDEIVIGAPLAGVVGTPVANVGSAYVYRANGELVWRFNGEHAWDYFGNSVACAGDVNADGYDDILVGAWRADPGGVTDAGSAYVYSGLSGELIDRHDGEGPNHNLGYSVRGAGDIDVDGYDDFMIGAHRADLDGLTDVGNVYVCTGKTGGYLWNIRGAASDDVFGASVAYAGDMTKDGRPDFLVGAFGADPDGRTDAGSVYLFGCPCDCAYNGDPAHDGVTDVLDVVGTVGDAFRGDPNDKSDNCRYCDSDVDCSGACDIIDVVKMVNVAFRGASKATEFCSGCDN